MALHNVGGVEVDYADFVSFPDHPPGVEHHTVTARKGIAAALAPRVSSGSRSIAHSQYLAGRWPIPEGWQRLRVWNQHRLLRALRPDVVILWNRLADFRRRSLGASPPQIIYREFSRAWLTEDHAREREILESTDTILCASRAARRVLELKYDLSAHHALRVCRSAVRPGCRLAGGPKKPPHGPVRIGFAGRLVGIKGLAILIHAVGELVRGGIAAHLLVAGRGPEEAPLRALVSRLDLEPHVSFLGFQDDLSRFFESIHCLVAPSYRDCLPLVCLEALASACPLVTPDIDGFPEIYRDGEAGFLLRPRLGPEEVETLGGAVDDWPRFVYRAREDRLVPARALEPVELARAIEELLGDPRRYQRFSRAALERANRHFLYSDFLRRFYQAITR